MSTDKLMYYELFNTKVHEFLKDLVNTFPNVQEFKKFKSGVILMENMDVKRPQMMFKEFVLSKYRDAIMNKDKDFLLSEKSYELTSTRKDYWEDFIKMLRDLWHSLDEPNREVIWKYFHVFVVLSDKCDVK